MKAHLLIAGASFCLGLACFVSTAAAQGPSGTVVSPTYSGPGKGVFVVRVTRIYETFLNGDGSKFDITVAANANNDAAGKVYGRSSTTVHVEPSDGSAFDFPGTYSLTGAMKTSGSRVQCTATASASGVAYIEGANRNVSLSVKYLFLLDPATGMATGTKSGSAGASGLGSSRNIEDAMFSGPTAGAETFYFQDWHCELQLQTAGTKVSGTATVRIGDGSNYPCTVSGKYTSATGISALKITGTGSGKGIKLTAQVANGHHVTSMSGSLLGQTVSATN